ncbi:MAG TPA: glycosyltransferase [Acidimicrobiales bacterium]|nr:glycosyltransferase [Acidimicrobiales bacterium]
MTVRVAVDLQALQVAGFAERGVGRYAAGYARAMARRGALAAAMLAPELPPPVGLPEEIAASGLARWDTAAECSRLAHGGGPLVYQVIAPFLHCAPGQPASLGIVEHWARTGLPRVVTLYDLIPLRAPHHYLPGAVDEERYRTRAAWVAASDLLLTISEYTRREAIEVLGCSPDSVVEVGAGVDRFFIPPDGADEELFRASLPLLAGRRFIMTVGGSDARKGTEQAIAALGLLAARGDDAHLLVAGHLTDAWKRDLLAAAAACGVRDRVVLAGAVSDELLRACYRRALLTLMPSLAEGAGLPVLESAACGTPALASDRAALVETAAVPEALFDPTDPGDIAAAVGRVLASEGLRVRILAAQQRLARASTWEAVAERACEALARFEPGNRAGWRAGPATPGSAERSRAGRAAIAWPGGRRPLRVAIAGPLPPAGGGIGAYNARLIEALASREDCEVEAVVACPSVAERVAGVPVISADSFGPDVRPASYHAVVYSLGNSAGHLPAVELSLRHPGWVWLHEARLPAVATTALQALPGGEFDTGLRRLVRRAYRDRSPDDRVRAAGRSHIELARIGVGLLPLLAERAAGLLVNSEAARSLVSLDLPPLAVGPPVTVLPPGCPPVSPPRAEPPGPPLLVAFGIVSAIKRPDVVVDAAALSGCRLAFVGPCPPVLEQLIIERAEILGCAERVEVVGAVDEGTLRDWHARATLAVQVRESGAGETSAAVLDALAAGVPVLTNMASAAEYPPGTVALVEDLDGPGVAARVAELLASPARLRELGEAGRAFAADHPFSRLAAELLAAVGTQ